MTVRTDQQQAAAHQVSVAVPFVFELRGQRHKLSGAEWEAFARNHQPSDSLDKGLNESEQDRAVCIPMLVRLRRSGLFQLRISLDVTIDNIVQRLTASSEVECQRPLELSSSVITFPPAYSGNLREAQCIDVTNVSELALQLTEVKAFNAEEMQVCLSSTGTHFLPHRSS